MQRDMILVLSTIALHLPYVVSARVISPARTQVAHNVSSFHEYQPLKLCDCQFATYGRGLRYPDSAGADGLACEEDGFFIAGFQTAGYPRDRRDELLPLSPAICCRPCVTGQKVNNDKAVAVLTTSCQPAEENAESLCLHQDFIQGFTNAERAVTADGRAQSFYPYGPAQCCKATMLLKSGKVTPLVPCRCADESGPSVSCGNKHTPEAAQKEGKLIYGFEHVYDIAAHRTVPTANAKCCEVCMDTSAPAEPAEECEGYNFCNGHGACRFGRCICYDDYTGPDCADGPNEVNDPLNGSSKWALILIVLAGCMLGCCSKLLVCSCERSRRRVPLMTTEITDMEEQLLQSGEDTSAEEWSTDTEDEDEEGEAEEDADEAGGVAPVAPGGQMQMTPAAVSATSSMRTRPNHEDEEQPEEADAAEEESCDPSELPVGEEAEMMECAEAETPAEPETEAQATAPPMECLVCMTERIQVVCVPCGHACMCRKCSRRLRRCPLCRTQVTRRQKLYLSTGVM